MTSALLFQFPFPFPDDSPATSVNMRALEAYLESVAPWSCRLYGTTVSGGKVVWAQDDLWGGPNASPYLDAGHTTRLVIPKTGRWAFSGGIGFTVTGTVKLTANGATDFAAAGDIENAPVVGARAMKQGEYVEMVVAAGTLAARFGGPWLMAERKGPM